MSLAAVVSVTAQLLPWLHASSVFKPPANPGSGKLDLPSPLPCVPRFAIAGTW